jgi:EAL domain-containing protein (putative c-di-GMP-specific phosphodiesterase class I)
LSKNLELVSVAEGVEDAEALAWLEKHGCNIVQGYYLAKPMPPDKFLSWLKNNTDESLRYKG